MKKETVLDRFGRIVLPKEIRDRHGLAPGAVLEVEDREGEIRLKPIHGEPSLAEKGGILVYTGKAAGDLQDAVRAVRRKRIEKHGRGAR